MVRSLRDSCEQVAKRLNPLIEVDKRRTECCNTCLQRKDWLIIEGWTSRHDFSRVEKKHLFGMACAATLGLVQAVGTPRYEIAHTISFSIAAGAHECGM